VVTLSEFDANFAYFYLKIGVAGGASAKFASLDTATIVINSGGVRLVVPVSYSLLAANAPNAFVQTPGTLGNSVTGAANVAFFTQTPNATVVVNNPVRNARVPDDEYTHVAAGIVYAAVGSSFLFTVILGGIAAALGSKAAKKL